LPTRRASTYINLHNINYTGRPKFAPIISSAHVVLQIDLHDSHRTMHEDDRGYYSQEGAIYPDDRHISISPLVSTLIQFHNVDYGLEQCTLTIIIPSLNMSHNPNTRLYPSDGTLVDIWELEMTDEISP
ncbi:hypothetical protein EV360DRAFT_29548, partial [Lentinula raphanica]